MPNLFLEADQEGGQTIDPAADIAAFLLEGGPEKFPVAPPDDKVLTTSCGFTCSRRCGPNRSPASWTRG